MRIQILCYCTNLETKRDVNYKKMKTSECMQEINDNKWKPIVRELLHSLESYHSQYFLCFQVSGMMSDCGWIFWPDVSVGNAGEMPAHNVMRQYSHVIMKFHC